VDNLQLHEQLFLVGGRTMLQKEKKSLVEPAKIIQSKTATGSVEYLPDSVAPAWWFQNFNPIWGPLVQWLRRQKHMTLAEFQFNASHVPGLTAIEKTIVVSAFIAYKNMQY
jgi:hypothetical protein